MDYLRGLVSDTKKPGTERATMLINKHGVVIITQNKIRVEDWLVEREPTDPIEMTSEQLLVHTATKWALKQLQFEVMKAAAAAGARREISDKAEPKSLEPSHGQN